MNVEVIDDARFEKLRKMTGPERLQLAWEISSSVMRVLRSFLRTMHPDWSDGKINRQAVRIMSDEDIHGSDCPCCHGE